MSLEFAQSREDDDLFADDFEPATEPTVIEEAPSVIPSHAPLVKTPESNNDVQPPLPTGHSNNHNYRNNRDRGGEKKRGGGGGRGRGNATQNGLHSSRYASHETESISTPPTEPPSAGELPPAGPSETAAPSATDVHNQPAKPILSVRGDRSLTGGPSHKKLTEEELTAKLERMKIINAEKSESFRKSEKDREGYAEKEKEERRKRKEELETRKLMEGERTKNRERKLKAMGGREWDEGKDEKDFEDKKGRSSQYVRGGHGGVIRGSGRGGLASSRFNDEGEGDAHTGGYDNYMGRGSGRGSGRGNGNGRGRDARPTSQKQQNIPVLEDFPSLPKPSTSMATKSDPKSPLAGAGDWADEMATPVEDSTKKHDV